MRNKRVLLIESGYFIGGVIHNLLQSNDALTVIEAQPRSAGDLLAAIHEFQPDVIMLDDTLDFDWIEDLMAYLRSHGDLQIMIVNNNANQIDVYQKSQVAVRQSQDLFNLLVKDAV